MDRRFGIVKPGFVPKCTDLGLMMSACSKIVTWDVTGVPRDRVVIGSEH